MQGHYEQRGDVQEWVWDPDPAPTSETEQETPEPPRAKRTTAKRTKEK